MEHHSVNRVSRFFPSSFHSCKFRSVPDVVQCSIPITKTTKILDHNIDPIKSFSNVSKTPSMIKSREPKTPLKDDKNVSKHYQKKSLLLGSDVEGRRCPPVTRVSVMASKKKERAKETKMNSISVSSSNSGRWFSSDDEEVDQFDGKSDTFFSLSSCSSESFRLKTAKTNATRVDNKTSTELGRCTSALSAYSINTTLSQCSPKTTKTSRKTAEKFGNSTRSNSKTGKTWQRKDIVCDDFVMNGGILKGCKVSEASTELYYNGFGSHHCTKTTKSRRKTGNRRSRRGQMMRPDHKGQCSILVEDGIEDSYAVEKSTRDPYNDFRTSMVEMIIEKQIFGVKDLEKLLDCFLSLNSPCYHRVILEVFTEICDMLFAN